MQTIAAFFRFLLGRFSYAPAPWMRAVNAFCRRRPFSFGLLVLMLVFLAVGVGYLMQRPGPTEVVAAITPPGPPADRVDPRPDDLVVRFDLDPDSLPPDAPPPDGTPSVARIDLIGKTVDGIVLSPAMAGRWQWTDDGTLTFAPDTPWPAGTRFSIDFPPAIFTPETHLKRMAYAFTTPTFEASIEDLAFYQDPTDSTVRRVVATLLFSHAVDGKSLESHLSMAMRPSGAGIDTPPTPVGVSVTYDDPHRRAYLQSDSLELPPQSNTLRLTVAPGVRPAAGGAPTAGELSDTVVVPDRYSFLKVTGAGASIATNDREDPEQVIHLGFTDAIAATELDAKLRVYLLPAVNPRRHQRRWNSPRDVTDADLAAAETVALRALPNPREASTDYHFVIDVPENRYLYLRIEPQLTSVNGFIQADFYDAVLPTPRYPRQVKLAGDGAIVNATGPQHLGVMARSLTAVRATVGRLLPGQIAHLITQTDGDIRDPYFTNPHFSEDDIADITRTIVDLKPVHPGRATYTALDMAAYRAGVDNGYGLFFVHVEGWDRTARRPVHGADDRRLILVTDLGLMVKNNADGSHDLFVQSFRTGRPVAGAAVRLLGKNGLPLFERTTDADGHASIPVTRDFRDERRPSVYLVSTDGDTAFIPFEGFSRQIDTSRFDVGGIAAAGGREGALTGFIFSDRGIYRPGDTVHLGMIVKKAPLDDISGIPLEVVIQGPRHNTVRAEKRQLPEKGFFELAYATDATANTGRYRVSLYLVRDDKRRGRLLGSAGFAVEEFIPDTMKITSTLVEAPARGWTTAETLTARVTLTNLFGAPAAGHRVQPRVTIRPAHFHFDAYADYIFTDPLQDDGKPPLRLDEALPAETTDEKGQVQVQIPLDRFRNGTYQLDFTAEGFDAASGRSVAAARRTLISPLPHLVGVKPDGDLGFIHAGADRQVSWSAIGADLSPIALDGLTLTRIEIQHISTLVKQPNGTFAYQTVDREVTVDHRPFAIAASGTAGALITDTPGDWAVEIHDAAGTRLARLTYTVVGHGNLTGRLEKDATLQLKLEKNDYRAGETIRLSITAPYVGSGLITIESDRVHAFKWFKTDTASTLESIRLPEDIEGNAYVSVAFLRDAASKEIFTSPLSAAVAPITIDRRRRRLDVALDVPDIVKPGDTLTIGYRVSRPSRIAVFAVDEGILQVARYRTPDPLGFFMQKRALGVTTLQMLDLILPEYRLMREVMASGGGMMQRALAAGINPFARRVDTPAAFWSGIVDAGPDQRTVDFRIPDSFSGNLVVMAVAVGAEAAGSATANTRVRGPFVLSPGVLLQSAPGDTFTATVGVANLVTGSGKKAPVEVNVTTSDNLDVVGGAAMRLAIDEGGESRASFQIRAGTAPGAARITFTARLGEETGQRTATLSIRPAMPYLTTFASGYIKDGRARIDLTRRLFAELADQRVSASPSPLVLVDALTAYLAHYPHGCTEQLVSQVFPLVGLMGLPAFAPAQTDIDKQVGALMDRLRERQRPDGGFSFWPGGDTTADFPSIYAMHFLIEAGARGFPVPSEMLGRGTAYLRQVAARKVPDMAAAGLVSRAIYLLTRQGETTTNLLVRLQEQLERQFAKTWPQDPIAIYMAATYSLLKMDDDARRLVDDYTPGAARTGAGGDFNGPLAREAQVLYLLSRHFPGTARRLGGEAVMRVVEPIFRGETNTIGASYGILALSEYGRIAPAAADPASIRFTLTRVDGPERELAMSQSPFPTAAYTGDAKAVAIAGSGPLFYMNVQSGFDRTLPATPLRDGLEIHRDFVDAAGEVQTAFTQGQEVTVRLRVRSLGDGWVSNVAITDLLPGGFEVVRDSVPRRVGGWRADYVDVREDRVIFYGRVDSHVRELTYRVKVTAAGTFTRPPAMAESMYDPTLKARTTAGEVTVDPAP